MKSLKIVRVSNKMVWVNDGKRVVKFNRTHIVTQPSKEERKNISELRSLDSHLPPNVLNIEVLKPNDPRGTSGFFDEAIADEIVGLLKKLALRAVVRQHTEDQANMLGDRLFLAI